MTGTARAVLTPQYCSRSATLPSLPGRTRKCTTGALPRQQRLDEALADEAGGAGDEILHAGLLCLAMHLGAKHRAVSLEK